VFASCIGENDAAGVFSREKLIARGARAQVVVIAESHGELQRVDYWNLSPRKFDVSKLDP
jgi:hypothetical protein